jgi:hypothetical protein
MRLHTQINKWFLTVGRCLVDGVSGVVGGVVGGRGFVGGVVGGVGGVGIEPEI